MSPDKVSLVTAERQFGPGSCVSGRLVEASKFLSFVLRHQPEAIGVALVTDGWSNVNELIAGAAR